MMRVGYFEYFPYMINASSFIFQFHSLIKGICKVKLKWLRYSHVTHIKIKLIEWIKIICLRPSWCMFL